VDSVALGDWVEWVRVEVVDFAVLVAGRLAAGFAVLVAVGVLAFRAFGGRVETGRYLVRRSGSDFPAGAARFLALLAARLGVRSLVAEYSFGAYRYYLTVGAGV
jgi:hypothetical protein